MRNYIWYEIPPYYGAGPSKFVLQRGMREIASLSPIKKRYTPTSPLLSMFYERNETPI